MSSHVECQLDREVNALYIRLGPGKAARAIAVTDSVYADVDADGTPIGLVFVNADQFVPILRQNTDDTDLPPEIRKLFRVFGA